LKNIILEDACPLGKLEKWLIKFGSKYIVLQMWKKSLMMCPMMGLPIDFYIGTWISLILPITSSKSDMRKCLYHVFVIRLGES
jgi:hypothetical protein